MSTRQNTYLDAELAREIMGWSVVPAGEEEWLEKAILRGERLPMFAYWPEGGTMVVMDGIDPTKTRDFRPTADVAHAVEVIEKLRTMKYKVILTGDDWRSGTGWKVEIFRPFFAKVPLATEESADNLPLAISKAALKTVRTYKKEAE